MVKHAHVASGTVLQTVMECRDKTGTPALLLGLHRTLQAALTRQGRLFWLLLSSHVFVFLVNCVFKLGTILM